MSYRKWGNYQDDFVGSLDALGKYKLMRYLYYLTVPPFYLETFVKADPSSLARYKAGSCLNFI